MNRKKWVDTAKGIGIILVVIGHIYEGLPKDFIYIFHMPFFFFLSGYLHHADSNKRVFLYKKVASLIVPYTIYLITLYPFQNPFNFSDFTVNSFLYYLNDIIYGGIRLINMVGTLWFLPCLFLTQQISNTLILSCSKGFLYLTILILLVISYVHAYEYPGFDLPLSTHILAASIPIYLIGYFSHKELNYSAHYINLIKLSTILYIAVSVPLIISTPHDMKRNAYGIPFISTLTSLSISAYIFLVSYRLSHFQKLEGILSKIGKASLTIMILHQPVQLLVKKEVSNNTFIRTLSAIFISYLMHQLFIRFRVTRMLFLGQKEH